MHIPDGYLSPQTYAPFYAVSLSIFALGLKKMRKALASKHVPYVAMAAAFSFLIMMFNIPVPGGTTGHAVGAAIVALFLGPWTAVVAVSVVLVIQALVFGDGGVTALGANCFNMAIVMPFISYWTFRMVKGPRGSKRRAIIASFLAGYLGLSVAALCAGLELGLQPLIAHGPDGRPLFAPYPLWVAVPAITVAHLLAFSIFEGIVTALLFSYFLRHESTPLYAMKRETP